MVLGIGDTKIVSHGASSQGAHSIERSYRYIKILPPLRIREVFCFVQNRMKMLIMSFEGETEIFPLDTAKRNIS
jgi:hypothetical protein